MTDHIAYLRKRLTEERMRAEAAQRAEAKRAHLELAAVYPAWVGVGLGRGWRVVGGASPSWDKTHDVGRRLRQRPPGFASALRTGD